MNAAPGKNAGDSFRLNQAEREKILSLAHGPVCDYEAKTLAALIESALSRHANLLAIDGLVQRTYAELETESRRLAGTFETEGDRERPVAIHLPAGIPCITTMLSVIRSGRCFICLNPNASSEETRALLALARPSLVIATEEEATRLKDARWEVRTLTKSDDCRPNFRFPSRNEPDDLSYLVATSGTTGRPKIIQIEHHSVANLIQSISAIYGLAPGDRRFQSSQPGPDFFLAEILIPLCAGATLVFSRKNEVFNPPDLLAQLKETRITVAGLPSSYWRELVRYFVRKGHAVMPSDLRLLIVGMETVDAGTLDEWNRLVSPKVTLLNAYGPSETTMIATTYPLGEGIPEGETRVPIGKPVANSAIYIVESVSQLLPMGTVGEICISGAGLMRGYAGRDPEKDLPSNPYASRPEFARLYRTGDFGFLRPDGNFVFVERRDGQVKIRGHRVELATVEMHLSHAAGGANTVAAAIPRHGQDILVGLVESDGAISAEAIRAHLRDQVKDVLIPSIILLVPEFPRLPNGKIDRQLLKKRAEQAPTVELASTPISVSLGGTLGKMIEIWNEVFATNQCTAESHFFEMGGTSLLAIRLSVLTQEQLGLNLPLHYFYSEPTLRGLVRQIEQRSDPAKPGSILVPLAKGPGPNPIFAVHGWGGRVFIWPRFAAHFSGERDCWGIQGFEHVDLERPRTMREMCDKYADVLRENCADQPVILLGYSLGGVIAYETARRFAAKGGRVRRVVLLDPPPPKTLAGYGAHCLLEPLRRRFPALRKLWWKIKHNPPLPTQNEQNGSDPGGDPYVPIVQYYYAKKCDLPVLYIHRDSVDRGLPRRWSQLLHGPCELAYVPTGHHEMILEPAISEIVQIVRTRA